MAEAGLPGAQWAADPTGRFELRYWDGTKWTDYVATAGVQSVDALRADSAPAETQQFTLAAAAGAAVVSARWAADPTGRFELRYWDGTQWTDAVARGGVQSIDSLRPASISTDPTPAEPVAVDAAPTRPAAVEPAPIEPVPVDPVAAEPVRVEPAREATAFAESSPAESGLIIAGAMGETRSSRRKRRRRQWTLVGAAIAAVLAVGAIASGLSDNSTKVASPGGSSNSTERTFAPTSATSSTTSTTATTTTMPPTTVPTTAQPTAPPTVPPTAPPTDPPTVAPPPPPQQTCYPLSNGGNCYQAGQFCRATDHGASGISGSGQAITCVDNNGWRWEPA
jgi:hypothetical protein